MLWRDWEEGNYVASITMSEMIKVYVLPGQR